MVSAISQLAGAPIANLVVIAAVFCIGVAIFGWARETLAASPGFRKVSGLTGVLLLFCVYGLYLPNAAHSNDAEASDEAEAGRPAQTQTAPVQQAGVARQTESSAQQGEQSANQSVVRQSATLTVPASTSSTQSKQQQISQPAAAPSPQTSAAQNFFSGRWKNAEMKAAGILFLKIEEHGQDITVHAWGSCGSQYCDWGTGQGVVRDGEATVSWKQGPVVRKLKLQPDGDSLRVVLDSASRGRPQHIEAHFAKSL